MTDNQRKRLIDPVDLPRKMEALVDAAADLDNSVLFDRTLGGQPVVTLAPGFEDERRFYGESLEDACDQALEYLGFQVAS